MASDGQLGCRDAMLQVAALALPYGLRACISACTCAAVVSNGSIPLDGMEEESDVLVDLRE